MASDAVSVLDRLGLASAHVVGVSLGGMVAQELAIARPDRVRSLVLCSTTAGGADARTPCPLTLIKELKRIDVSGTGSGRVRAWGALHQAAAAACHDATRRLHRVLAPTLILHGRADELLPLRNAERLASEIPGATLCAVPGGTHLLIHESPTARDALFAWLDEHRADAPMARPHGAGARRRLLPEAP